jgi:hypothetical protein
MRPVLVDWTEAVFRAPLPDFLYFSLTGTVKGAVLCRRVQQAPCLAALKEVVVK